MESIAGDCDRMGTLPDMRRKQNQSCPSAWVNEASARWEERLNPLWSGGLGILLTTVVRGGGSGRRPLIATGHFEAMALLLMSQQVLWASSARHSPLTDCHLKCFLWVRPYSFYNLRHSIVLRVSPKSWESVHIERAGPVLRSRMACLRCKVEAGPSSRGFTKNV